MKKYFLLFILILSSLFCFSQEKIDYTIDKIANDIVSPLNEKTILCILDFSSPKKEMSSYIQTQLISNITETGKVRVVTRSNMDKIDNELKYQMSGLVSEDTALSICKRLGASAIVFGQVTELDNKYNLQVKMLDVETGSYLLFRTYTFSRSSKSEQLLGRAANYCKTSLGVIIEANKNSIIYVSPAVGLYFDYNIFRKLTVGANAIVSYDAFNQQNTIYSLEPLAILRYYLVSPSGEPSTGLFIQAEFGVDLIFTNSDFNHVIDAGGGIGFRKEFSNLYVEPSVRFGYPYLFGAEMIMGIRF